MFGRQLFVEPKVYNWRRHEESGKVSYVYVADNSRQASNIKQNLDLSPGERIIINTNGASVTVHTSEDLIELAKRCKLTTFDVANIEFDHNAIVQKAIINKQEKSFVHSGAYGAQVFLEPKIHNWYKHDKNNRNFYFYVADNVDQAKHIHSNLSISPGKQINLKTVASCVIIDSDADLIELASRCGVAALNTSLIEREIDNKFEKSTQINKDKKFLRDSIYGEKLFVEPKIQNWRKRDDNGKMIYFYIADNFQQANTIQSNFHLSPGEPIIVRRSGSSVIVDSDYDLTELARRCSISSFDVSKIQLDKDDEFSKVAKETKKQKFARDGLYGKELFLEPKIQNWYKIEIDEKVFYFYRSDNQSEADNIVQNIKKSPGIPIVPKRKGTCVMLDSVTDLTELAKRCGILSVDVSKIKTDTCKNQSNVFAVSAPFQSRPNFKNKFNAQKQKSQNNVVEGEFQPATR